MRINMYIFFSDIRSPDVLISLFYSLVNNQICVILSALNDFHCFRTQYPINNANPFVHLTQQNLEVITVLFKPY